MRVLALPSCVIYCLIAAGCASTETGHHAHFASDISGAPQSAPTTAPTTAPDTASAVARAPDTAKAQTLVTTPNSIDTRTRPVDELTASQDIAIERWQECLQSNQQRLGYTFESVMEIADKVVFICQGHADDVVATFPEQLRTDLGDIMEEQAYEETLKLLAYRHRVTAPISLGQEIVLKP